MKKSFTIIELIFAIAILSIIGIISTQILANIYEQYIFTKTINELETKTELALAQIANRLQYRVKEATIARKLSPNDTDITVLSTANENYKILEWIGYDYDSFRGMWDDTKKLNTPGWSGFIDLYSSDTNKSQIKTPGSFLFITDQIIKTLSNGKADLTTKENVAIIFKGLPLRFDIKEYGWNDFTGTIKHKYINRVKCPKSKCKDILEFVENNITSRDISEQYYLTWTAYAVVPDNNSVNTNLRLYYNYRPWMGEKYSDGKSSLLIENVTVFKFRQSDKVIYLKLCINKPITNDFNVSICKEKVVY